MTVPAAPEPIRRAPPCALVVFGASGDLTRRKLIPALYSLASVGTLPERFAALGFSRRHFTNQEFRQEMLHAVGEFSRRPVDPQVWKEFAADLDYLQGEFENESSFENLSVRLQQLDHQKGLEGNRLFYLATPPSEYARILRSLKRSGLIRKPGEGPWTRVIVEKPIGRDLVSARELNALVASVLDETQIFRIDHYLGKETVQNILVFRFANSIFEPVWNRKYVDFVEITAAESEGVGTRGKFYDQTGVLRDIVQNHLLELLALTAMEPPTTGSADDIRSEKLQVLNALRDPTPESIPKEVVLGQYQGYRDETDVAPDSITPTYAALRVHVDNWRWQGVPFCLRTGKKLATRMTEVAIHMQPIPLSLFGKPGMRDTIQPNVLTLRIQPDEGIQLEFASKIPGDHLSIGEVKMDMTYTETFGGEPPEAYERLLLDAMRGDATLFSRSDWVEASWAWIDPIIQYSEKHPPRDFPNYAPGTAGPRTCDQWMEQDRRSWRQL